MMIHVMNTLNTRKLLHKLIMITLRDIL